LATVRKGLNEFMARKARLEAERDEMEEITFPVELSVSVGAAEIAQLRTVSATAAIWNVRLPM
jgi:HlyD family secretion protein